MRVLAANIEEVFREAAARFTLIAYFILSSLFILLFAAAINLDVVDGALAGAKIFGASVQMGRQKVEIDQLVLGFEAGFSAVLYLVGTFLAIFATAHLVPRLQEKGTIDLYLSRPVGRVHLLLSRYAGGIALASANLAYLIGAIWLTIVWKTGVVNPRFLLSGVVILFATATLMAFGFLIGVVTSSTNVSIMSTYALFFVSAILAGHDKIEAALSSEWSAGAVHALYVALPKTSALGAAVVQLVAGGLFPDRGGDHVTIATFASTALFGAACLGLAAYLFKRKDF